MVAGLSFFWMRYSALDCHVHWHANVEECAVGFFRRDVLGFDWSVLGMHRMHLKIETRQNVCCHFVPPE